MRECRYEYMYPDDFVAAVREMPVFIMPTGLLEWHANHLPLGLDSMKAYSICLDVARKLGGGIVLPPNYYGRPGYSTYTGTLTYSEEAMSLLFYETMEQLKKVGAKVIAIVAGHYGDCQVDFLRKVSRKFAEANPDVRVIAKAENEGILIDGRQFGDHAGKWETSVFWSLYPDLVRWETYDTKISDMKIYEDAPHGYFDESAEWDFGEDLRETASVALGKRVVGCVSDAIADDIRKALETIDQ